MLAPQMRSTGGYRSNANTKPDAADYVSGADARQKETSTWIAKLALADHAVHKGLHGGYICCKYNLTYYAKNFDELKAFAIKLGVKP